MNRRCILTLGAILFVLCALVHPAYGDLNGMVTRIQGADVVVNLGQQKVQPGMRLYVYDAQGRALATVQVTDVDEASSHVQIVAMEPGASLNVGSTVSDRAYAPSGVPPLPSVSPVAPVAVPAARPVAPLPGASPLAGASPGIARLDADGKPIDEVKAFKDAVKAHTVIHNFRGGKPGTVKINSWDAWNIVSTVGILGSPYGAIMNPWLIAGTGFGMYNTYNYSSRMNVRAKSSVQIVYWDADMATAYANYYVYKEGIADPVRREELRRSLMAQKGVQTSAVFQLRIHNAGPSTLQISPFDWHCYMIDPLGNRVKAERYDESLDKVLNPGQEADGYIFFPRRDPLGKEYVASPPKLVLEDIFGERATIRFDRVK